MTKGEIEREFEKLVPGIVSGMYLLEAMTLILQELKRLKEIEGRYEGLYK